MYQMFFAPPLPFVKQNHFLADPPPPLCHQKSLFCLQDIINEQPLVPAGRLHELDKNVWPV